MPATYLVLHTQQYRQGDFSIVPLRYEDRFLIMRWRNEQIYHLRQPRPLTEADQQRYFDTVVSRLFDLPRPDQILFSYLEGERCIGYGGLVHINWTDRNAEVSFIMDTQLEADHFAEHWSNFLAMLKRAAFEDLGLHKIFTYAFDLRPHLYGVLEQSGFVREATLKEHCLFEGTYRDVILHGCFCDRFQIINYVDCTPEQHREILALRNRDDVRKWMVNPDPIPEENHFRFVESLRGNPDRIYMAICKEGALVGTCNLTREEDGVWERGIVANPDRYVPGQTAAWERQIFVALPEKGITALTAKVQTENLRSIRYHEKMGFVEQRREGGYIYYLLRLV